MAESDAKGRALLVGLVGFIRPHIATGEPEIFHIAHSSAECMVGVMETHQARVDFGNSAGFLTIIQGLMRLLRFEGGTCMQRDSRPGASFGNGEICQRTHCI